MDGRNWKERFFYTWRRVNGSRNSDLPRNKFGTTVVSHAAECGNLEITEFLVQNGAEVDAANSDGSTPLHIAAKFGRKDIANFLLNIGVSVDICDKDGCTPLHYVAHLHAGNISSLDARESYQELVHIFLDRNVDINAVDSKGRTAVFLAAQNSRKHLVELFLKLGANLEGRDAKQWTILHHICEKGWTGIVRTIIEERSHEIDLNARTYEGSTPVIIAAYYSHEELVKLLLESGVKVDGKGLLDYSLLHFACQKGWLEVAKTLVGMGLDLDAKAFQEKTSLIVAAEWLHLSVVEYLIECGSEVNCCTERGQTLLHFVCRNGWLELAQVLVSKGYCDLNVKDSQGKTLLIAAASCRESMVAMYLIGYGVDVTCCDQQGYTILHYACERGWLNVVKSLTRKAVDVNVLTVNHNTPLHLAIQHCKFAIMEHLLNAGADCNITNLIGETAFNAFIQNTPRLEAIILFIRNGAYLQPNDYAIISNNIVFKEAILQSTELCTMALINKFYNADLHNIYEIPALSGKLPRIEVLKTVSKGISQDITEMVNHEIQTKGYCNVMNIQTIMLSRLCVLTLMKHYNIVPR